MTPIAYGFPDYDLATLPPIPTDWTDSTWKNDICPSWSTPNGLTVWTDYLDPKDRDWPCIERERFQITRWRKDGCGVDDLLSADNWADVLAYVQNYQEESN